MSNRVHHQLWRCYPQMLKLSSDAAAPWLLELWTIAPTPNKGSQLRKSTVERLLKQHRIRRVTAEIVVNTLKEPAITVADGVTAAACAHMRSLVARLRLVNRELQESEHKLDELCSAVGEVDAVQEKDFSTVTLLSLDPCQASAELPWACCSPKVRGFSRAATIRGSGHCAARLPSLGVAANHRSSSCATLRTLGCATQSTTGTRRYPA